MGLINEANISPSPELSYVYGVILGDGDIGAYPYGKRVNYRTRLRCKDREFAEEFRRCLSRVVENPVTLPKMYEGETLFDVHTQSKPLYDFVVSGSWHAVEQFPAEFVRGFMDSEGSISYWNKPPWGPMGTRVGIKIDAKNTDLKLLEFIGNLLRTLGIKTKIRPVKLRISTLKSGKRIVPKRQGFELSICGKRSIVRYAKQIGFSIKRKNIKLKEAIKKARWEWQQKRDQRTGRFLSEVYKWA